MEPTPELDQLCRHFGVAAQYRDFADREHHADDATRRSLLRALGVEAGDPRTERRSLEVAIDMEWRRRLPPVLVHRQGDPPPTLALTLPDDAGAGPGRFVLTEENGARAEGRIDLEALPAEARRDIDGVRWVRRLLEVAMPAEPGYHHLALYLEGSADEVDAGGDTRPSAQTTIIVAPRCCWQPQDEGGRRGWGLVTQLHAVRSARNWGIGDFTDLTRLVETAAAAGAGTVALNPLHALFLTRPERCDPYGPSSRRYLNPLFIDVEAVPELAECPQVRERIDSDAFQARLRALRGGRHLDYTGVTIAKLDILGRLFRHFRSAHLDAGSPRGSDFQAFRDVSGPELERFSLYQALAEHLQQEGHDSDEAGFEGWPAEYRNPTSRAVQAFAEQHPDRVDFFAWLQWLAEQQLAAASARCRALGMDHGLCLDLAVGAAPDGADRWAAPDRYVAGAAVGAPPDDFSPRGQNWHVLAWHPQRLREAAYAPLAAELGACMRHAGALRIDHVMGLMRLFLVPDGAAPDTATYVAYPFADLLGVLALESVRNRCLIIGEDLGTVPPEVRAAMPDWGLFSTRVLYFERDGDGDFLPPGGFPRDAMVTAGTHDLPPLKGFWAGVDLERRRELDLFPAPEDYAQRLLQRTHDRTLLLLALQREGLLPADRSTDPVAVPELTPEHLEAVQVYLARTPSRLLLIQTADLLGETEQTNLPGAGRGYPNWRQRQPLELEHWLAEPAVARVLAAVCRERAAAGGPRPTDRLERARAGTPTEPAPSDPAGPGPQAQPNSAAGAGNGPLQPTIPLATYRLQLQPGFGFADAAALVPYLAALGISHVYCSPYFQARPGSTHGYDVVAHDRLNAELGTREDYEHFCDALADHGMSQVLDLVPNHVGIMGADNPWWLDLLENGPAAEHAPFFDIDWQPLKAELHGKVLVPVLGGHYGDVLDQGALRLVFTDGAFRVEYYEHHFPVDPREYPRILAPGLAGLRERLGAASETLAGFESLVTAFGNLPPRDALDADSLAERRRDKELHKGRLAELTAADADLAHYVDDCIRQFNGAGDQPADRGRLHALLEAQAYRLAHWRVAADEINYRRFFDINDLAALRMEHPDAFDAVHALVLDLIAEGRIQGLRIDHPDGLYDPAGYFRRLQRQAAAALAPTRTPRDDDRPLYLVAEKILAADEVLRGDWAVHGTTGYDFATLSDALMVDPAGEQGMTACYRQFTGRTLSFAEETHQARRVVMRGMLSGELHRLASELSRIAELDPHTRDYTLDALRGALLEVVACFPVYRTYIDADGGCDTDRHQVLKAVSEARRRTGMPDLSVFDFVRDVLLTDIAEGKPAAYRERVLRLARSVQQYTSPVAAKGVEDTAFYRWHRLVSLNEVGGEPERFGIDTDTFHRACARRRDTWPHGMLAGSTHDSKRSDDVRARIHVLSELPGLWCERVNRWALLNRRLHRTDAAGQRLPDTNAEYLFYQTLVGVWPQPDAPGDLEGTDLEDLRARLRDYMAKAAKEAKLHTSWTNEEPEYEEALAAFVDDVADPGRSSAFLADFLAFLRPVARLGLLNSLSLALLRLTAPGVPDIYQGSELWNLCLVDPDNRRPVDFALRRRLLAELPEPDGAAEDVPDWRHADGRAKMHLIHQALRLRARMPALFADGDYRPLAVEGALADHLIAFARVHEGRAVVALAPRLLAPLALPAAASGDLDAWLDPFDHPDWLETLVEVPSRYWQDELAGGTVEALDQGDDAFRLRAGDVLRRFPVGLLAGDSDAG
jgi:(1->4)-alpha-D-glucan 1-alpha-D-glucosylmutase